MTSPPGLEWRKGDSLRPHASRFARGKEDIQLTREPHSAAPLERPQNYVRAMAGPLLTPSRPAVLALSSDAIESDESQLSVAVRAMLCPSQ